MPAVPGADHGAGAWANYAGPRAPAEVAAARPWPSAAAASASDGSGGRIAAGDHCRQQCTASAGRVCLSTGCGGGGRRPAVQGGGLATGGARYGGPKRVGEVWRLLCRLAG